MHKTRHDISCWSWSKLLTTIKENQICLSSETSSGIFEKYMNSLTERLTSSDEFTPSPSSSSEDSTRIRMSFDSKSTESHRKSCVQTIWWFGSLSELNTDVIEKVIKVMIDKNFDNFIISRFLFFFLHSNSRIVKFHEMRKIVEAVISLLYSLDWNYISSKSLVRLFSSSHQIDISKTTKEKLEIMMGSQMDSLTVDNLLVAAPGSVKNLYDVNLVRRLLRSFMNQNAQQLSLERLRKVAELMDLYMTEIAPDPFLNLQKFLSLVLALPGSARESHDGLYCAISIYIEFHSTLCDEEKKKLCCGLEYERLSVDAWTHLSNNRNFPKRIAIQALVSRQAKFKGFLNYVSFQRNQLTVGKERRGNSRCYPEEDSLTSTDNSKLKTQLEEMQGRVMELEKMCRKMQSQVDILIKSRGTNYRSAKSVPKLCP